MHLGAGALLLAFSAAHVGADTPPPEGQPYPRGVAAASAMRGAQSIADALEAPSTAALVHGIGGVSADTWAAWLAGNLFSAVGALAAADGEWARVVVLAGQRHDASDLANALAQRVEIALSQGDYARCQALAEELAKVADASDNQIEAAFAEANIGVIERRRGHLDGALAHQERALQISRNAGDPYGAAQSLTNLATVYRDRGDFAKALDMALEAVALRERTGDKLEIAYRNVGLLYREIEDGTTSRQYFERALEVAAKRAIPAAYSPVIGAYAGLLNDLGEYAALRTSGVRGSPARSISRSAIDRTRDYERLENSDAPCSVSARTTPLRRSPDSSIAHARSRARPARNRRARTAAPRRHCADRARSAARARHARRGHRRPRSRAIASATRARLRATREQLARADHDDADAPALCAQVRRRTRGIARHPRQPPAGRARETPRARRIRTARCTMLAKDNELQAALLDKQRLERRASFAAMAGLAVLLLVMVWRMLSINRLNHALARRNAEVERQRIALANANGKLEAPGGRPLPRGDHRLA